MSGILTVIISIICIVFFLIGLIWLGFRIEPESFLRHPKNTSIAGTIELPPDLPEPVMRYYETAAGTRVPEVRSAVVWSKAKLRINGIWMPVRSKTYYLPGQAFLRYMEVTWFGLPILRVNDSFINGEGVTRIEGLLNSKESGEKINQGSNLALWGEVVFTPSIFVTDKRASWESLDKGTVRLVVPYGEQNDSLLFNFDPETGLITRISALRYKGQGEEKTPWLIDITEWMISHYIKIPSQFSVIWEDESSPWSYWTVEGVEYNVDISNIIKYDPESSGVKR